MGKNVAAVNLSSPFSITDQWLSIWKATRIMKSAGWTYKASTDGTGASGNKETAGAFLQDKWGPGGITAGHIQLGTQTGNAATIGTITNNQVTINGLTGMTANSAGHALNFSGAINAANNGVFTIITFNSSTSVTIFNPNAVAEGTSLTWSERVSGSGSITWSAVSFGREQTISGLSGLTPNVAGHYLYLTGSSNSNNNGVFQVLKYINSTSAVIINLAGGSDTATGDWTKLDPLLDIYPPLANLNFGSWTVYQGPSTLKIPINASSSGTFKTGENITQSGSGAQGQIIGYQFDVPTATGYLVVMPRQNGTGAGILGWSTVTSTITGGTSGATVTTAASSTPIEYVRESVFWKSSGNHNQGSIYQCIVDGYGESSNRFTSFLSATGCTNVVAPGGGGTNNGFPAIGAYVVKGTGGVNSGQNWLTSSATNLGKTSVFAANASYTTNVSADGTWTSIVGFPTSNTGSFIGIGFWALDNTEFGDVDPYVWFAPTISTYNEPRTGAAGSPPSTEVFCAFQMSGGTPSTWFKGWRRRGFSLGDMVQQFQAAALQPSTSANTLLYLYSGDNEELATSLASTHPRLKEPIWIVSTQTVTGTPAAQAFGKMRKGTLRWGYLTSPGFSSKQTLDSKTYVVLSNVNGPMAIGPWDGVSSLYQV